jgi:A/G-specific adenine glycosylase
VVHLVKDTIRKRLLTWYRAHQRPFPWRERQLSAYETLVAETMLQQTQATRVAERLPLFLQSYPTVHVLARATNAEIVRQWSGLGYNTRAIRLRDAARAVVQEHDGIVPDSLDALRSIPGIGPYTASAILCFAYHRRVPVVDVNIARVYSRLRARRTTNIEVDDRTQLEEVAHLLMPRVHVSEWHNAVMDLGARMCTARAPRCTSCPLQDACPSAGHIRTVVRERRAEPSHRDVPDRLWRGRLVKFFHTLEKRPTPRTIYTRVIGEAPSADDLRWLKGLLVALERDGVIPLR